MTGFLPNGHALSLSVLFPVQQMDGKDAFPASLVVEWPGFGQVDVSRNFFFLGGGMFPLKAGQGRMSEVFLTILGVPYTCIWKWLGDNVMSGAAAAILCLQEKFQIIKDPGGGHLRINP